MQADVEERVIVVAEEVAEGAVPSRRGGASGRAPLPKRPLRHVPLRTCVACGKKTDKGGLMRIVAQSEGGATMDPSGKAQGRGAYVCSTGDCAEEPVRRGRVEFALRRKISDDDWTEVSAFIESLGYSGR